MSAALPAANRAAFGRETMSLDGGKVVR